MIQVIHTYQSQAIRGGNFAWHRFPVITYEHQSSYNTTAILINHFHKPKSYLEILFQAYKHTFEEIRRGDGKARRGDEETAASQLTGGVGKQ